MFYYYYFVVHVFLFYFIFIERTLDELIVIVLVRVMDMHG